MLPLLVAKRAVLVPCCVVNMLLAGLKCSNSTLYTQRVQARGHEAIHSGISTDAAALEVLQTSPRA